MGVDCIQLLLHFSCIYVRKYVSPSVRYARVCQIPRLQILGDLVYQDAKAKGLSYTLSSSERKLSYRRS